MKTLLLVAAAAAVVSAPAGAAAPWVGPAPAVLAGQLVPSVNKVLATPVCGQYACSAPSQYRFARATCTRTSPLLYACTAPLTKAGVVQTEGSATNIARGSWVVRVTGTATRWRGAILGTPCTFDNCGGIDLSPLTPG